MLAMTAAYGWRANWRKAERYAPMFAACESWPRPYIDASRRSRRASWLHTRRAPNGPHRAKSYHQQLRPACVARFIVGRELLDKLALPDSAWAADRRTSTGR